MVLLLLSIMYHLTYLRAMVCQIVSRDYGRRRGVRVLRAALLVLKLPEQHAQHGVQTQHVVEGPAQRSISQAAKHG